MVKLNRLTGLAAIAVAIVGCGHPGYQAHISNVSQGGTSYQIERVPVAKVEPPPPVIPGPKGDAPTREQTLRDAADKWTAALKASDADAMNRLLEDRFILVGPGGDITTKDDFVGSVRGGQLVVESATVSDLRIQEYRDSAVLTGILAAKVTRDGNDISGNYRFTDTYVWKDNSWKKAAESIAKVKEQ